MATADLAWLRLDRPENLMVNNVVMWFDTPVGWDQVKQICRERLVGRFPRFRQRVAESRRPWRPVAWKDDPHFDLERHFHRLALPAPGDRAALRELVADLMATPLDHDKPLWDMYLVEGYGAGCAIVSRTHHAIADGIALARVLISLTDDAPDPCVTPAQFVPTSGAPPVTRPLQAAKDRMRALVKILRAGPDADTAIRGELGVTQRIAETRPIDLEGVKRAGHATGTTVNDVVLTALSGALGSYLRERGTPAAEIRVFVPFDLRPPGAPIPRGLGNKFGPVLVPLPVGIREPQQRLAEVHRRMSEIKHSLDGGISYNLLRLIGLMPRQIGRRFIDFSTGKASGLITNVPGPPGSVSLAGAPVRGIVVWAPQPGITSMSVTTFSYNNEVIVTLGVDAGLIPDPERIVAGVENEIAELERLAPASTELRAA